MISMAMLHDAQRVLKQFALLFSVLQSSGHFDHLILADCFSDLLHVFFLCIVTLPDQIFLLLGRKISPPELVLANPGNGCCTVQSGVSWKKSLPSQAGKGLSTPYKEIGQQKSAVKADRTHLPVQSDFVRRLAVSSE